MSKGPTRQSIGPTEDPAACVLSLRQPRLWLGSILVWGVLIVLMAMILEIANPEVEPFVSRVSYLGYFLGPWVILTPLLLALGTRVPLFGGPPGRTLVVHVPLLGVSILLYPAIIWLMAPEVSHLFENVSLLEGYVRYTILVSPLSVLLYVLLTGIGTLIELTGELRARRSREQTMHGRLTEARLEALQTQLEPHFLFNTLHAIAGLVRLGNQDRAVVMITRLSDLLRRLLGTSRSLFIPLREELQFLDDWMGIQRERLGDRLDASVRVPDDLLDVPVPPLVLQPLVENAVRHGIAPRADPGRLDVDVRRTEAFLVLTVENDGDPAGEIEEGVGLANTRARLEGLYGEDARLEVEPRSEGGVRAIVELPIRSESPVEGES